MAEWSDNPEIVRAHLTGEEPNPEIVVYLDEPLNPFDFFDRRVCLTTVDEEWQAAQTEFARVGLTCQKFQSIPDIGPHQSFNRSTRQILTEFAGSEDERLLFLEDDCAFQNLDHLGQALSELPEWDVVYLGANLLCWNRPDDPKPERHSEHLFRVKQAWTSHAIGYNKHCVQRILDGQPMFSEQMFDSWLSSQLPSLNAFVVAPMVAYQRPHYSLIWQRADDYSEIFRLSEGLLR